MEQLYDRCAGLDVHKDTVVACRRVVTAGRVNREVRQFSTMARGLLALGDWLEDAGCTHVAMESTGVYWKPVWYALENRFELVLANAAHIRNVPGRKSDMNDATWIADLVAHGLIRSSFVPPEPIQELRELTRTRTQLRREIVRHTQRIQRVLEDANVKLSSVVSDIMGMSGRRIIGALIEGERDPEKLAALGSSRLHASREHLAEALEGRVTTHHAFLLKNHLRLIEELEQTITEFDARITELMRPFRDDLHRLIGIPGVSVHAAEIILAEIGADMRVFATAAHLRSWAGLCPRQDESAGKHRSTRVRKGAPWLKPVLVQCAWAAARSKGTYLQSQFYRLKARRGPKKAAIAVAASILTSAYFMIRNATDYHDLGADYFARRSKSRIAARLARRIQELGYDITITPNAAA